MKNKTMKTLKRKPLEIVLFNLLDKSILSLVRTLGAPAKKVRQRTSLNYIYSTRKEDFLVKIFRNKVNSFRLERVYKSDTKCSAYMARMWLVLRRSGYNPQKYYGKIKFKKNGKRLDITYAERDDSDYMITVIGY